VHRQFWRKFNRQEAPARSAISHLVQKYEQSGSICDNKKGVVRSHRSFLSLSLSLSHTHTHTHTHRGQCYLCMQSASSESKKVCNMIYVPSHLVSKSINTPPCNGIWQCVPTKSKWYRCSLQPTSNGNCEFCQDFSQFMQQYLTNSDYDLVTKPISTSVGSWTRAQGSGPLKIHIELWKHHSILQNAPCAAQSESKGFLDWSLWRVQNKPV